MNLRLIIPSEEYLPSVQDAVAEFQAAPSKFEIGDIKKMIVAARDNFVGYFQRVRDESAGKGLPEGYVPQTTFWLVDDQKYIGTFCLRHRLTPNLKKIGGHIAYQIRPSELRKGYAYRGLRLCLDEAKKMSIRRALITCNADNPASYGVMHKAMSQYGGNEDPEIEINGVVEKRVWVNT